MSETLKPCPVCGNKNASDYTYPSGHVYAGKRFVHCVICGADLEYAIWQRIRPIEDELDAAKKREEHCIQTINDMDGLCREMKDRLTNPWAEYFIHSNAETGFPLEADLLQFLNLPHDFDETEFGGDILLAIMKHEDFKWPEMADSAVHVKFYHESADYGLGGFPDYFCIDKIEIMEVPIYDSNIISLVSNERWGK